MTTLFHINPFTQEETKVATFAKKNEAADCRDLMQAKCADQNNAYYFILFKEKGQTNRQFSDSFARQVTFMNASVQQHIKMMLS